MKTFNPTDLPKIAGQKVNLRPITMEDTELIVAWRNNPDVKKNFIYRGTMTPEIHKNWMETKVLQGEVVSISLKMPLPGNPSVPYIIGIWMLFMTALNMVFLSEKQRRGVAVLALKLLACL